MVVNPLAALMAERKRKSILMGRIYTTVSSHCASRSGHPIGRHKHVTASPGQLLCTIRLEVERGSSAAQNTNSGTKPEHAGNKSSGFTWKCCMHAAWSEAAAVAVQSREVAHKRSVRTAWSTVSAAAIWRQVEESQRTLRAAQTPACVDAQRQQSAARRQMQIARSTQPDVQRIAQRNLATSQRARSRTPVLGTLGTRAYHSCSSSFYCRKGKLLHWPKRLGQHKQ